MLLMGLNIIFVLLFTLLAALYFHDKEIVPVFLCLVVAFLNVMNLLDQIKKEVKKSERR